MKKPVLALSGKRFSGKDTLAAFLVESAAKRGHALITHAFAAESKRLFVARRGCGLGAAMVHVRSLEEQVAQTGVLGVAKVISEYICFDDNRALDNGWLEPLAP